MLRTNEFENYPNTFRDFMDLTTQQKRTYNTAKSHAQTREMEKHLQKELNTSLKNKQWDESKILKFVKKHPQYLHIVLQKQYSENFLKKAWFTYQVEKDALHNYWQHVGKRPFVEEKFLYQANLPESIIDSILLMEKEYPSIIVEQLKVLAANHPKQPIDKILLQKACWLQQNSIRRIVSNKEEELVFMKLKENSLLSAKEVLTLAKDLPRA